MINMPESPESRAQDGANEEGLGGGVIEPTTPAVRVVHCMRLVRVADRCGLTFPHQSTLWALASAVPGRVGYQRSQEQSHESEAFHRRPSLHHVHRGAP